MEINHHARTSARNGFHAGCTVEQLGASCLVAVIDIYPGIFIIISNINVTRELKHITFRSIQHEGAFAIGVGRSCSATVIIHFKRLYAFRDSDRLSNRLDALCRHVDIESAFGSQGVGKGRCNGDIAGRHSERTRVGTCIPEHVCQHGHSIIVGILDGEVAEQITVGRRCSQGNLVGHVSRISCASSDTGSHAVAITGSGYGHIERYVGRNKLHRQVEAFKCIVIRKCTEVERHVATSAHNG